MKKNFLFLLFIAVVLILPSVVSAEFVTATSVTQIVKSLAKLISDLAVFVTIVCWIITGLLFLTAQGDPSKLTKAKTALIWAVVGTAVAILSGTAATIINTAITSGV